ncbi:MAG TPA: hypothetical protein VF017_09580 [Thermoanaerobaculia bacterium]|nr:hypothetical protein [Thermoanaerobaculia bacterium]
MTEVPAEHNPYVGVRGLLALMTVMVALTSFISIMGSSVAFDGAQPGPVRAFALSGGVLGLYGTVVCLLLLARNPSAPTHAWAWWALSLAVLVANSLYAWLVAGQPRPLALGSMALCGVWLAYLASSQRVRATYGGPPGGAKVAHPPR